MGHNVTGIDITPAAIAAATEKAKKLNLCNVDFLVEDMAEIPPVNQAAPSSKTELPFSNSFRNRYNIRYAI